ncbi:MAG TPA: hypothetical protein VIK35_10725 [Verrucomicrobiae bacterium]
MNNEAPNNLAGRMEKEIRVKPGKNKEAAEQRASAVYVLNNELKAILNLNRPPARLNTAQTAAYLGFKPHDIPVLAARGFLKPLGDPMPNSDKYYARARVLERLDDEEWLSLATAALSQHWQKKNASKTKKRNGHARPVKK